MNNFRSMRLAACLGLLGVSACLQVDPQPDFDHARQLIEASTGRSDAYDPGAEALKTEELDGLLVDGLSLDEALHLALANNRELQAEFQEIGIANADWVQSRLMSNPSLDLLLRFPSGGGRGLLETILGVDLLELWRIPARKEAAQKQLEFTVLRIAASAAQYLAESKEAYYSAVAANEQKLVAEENLRLAQRSLLATQQLHAAGAADAFDVSLARGPWLSAQLALQTASMDSAQARRELAKRLSLKRNVDELQLSDELPSELPSGLDAEALVTLALASRLDLQAIETSVRALDAHVQLEERKAWGDVSAGPGVERPAGGGDTLLGPSLSLTLPIFDQNQAQVARAGFKLQQMVKLYAAAQVTIAQDVRSATARLAAASQALSFYGQELLPHSQRTLDLVQASFAAGQSPLRDLVEAQRQFQATRSAHVALRLEGALAVGELTRKLGTPGPWLAPGS